MHVLRRSIKKYTTHIMKRFSFCFFFLLFVFSEEVFKISFLNARTLSLASICTCLSIRVCVCVT